MTEGLKYTHQYYKYEGTRGKRFFRISTHPTLDLKKCVQVCVSVGDKKRGRGSMVGVSVVSFSTIACNYMAYNGWTNSNAESFDQAFDQVVAELKKKVI